MRHEPRHASRDCSSIEVPNSLEKRANSRRQSSRALLSDSSFEQEEVGDSGLWRLYLQLVSNSGWKLCQESYQRPCRIRRAGRSMRRSHLACCIGCSAPRSLYRWTKSRSLRVQRRGPACTYSTLRAKCRGRRCTDPHNVAWALHEYRPMSSSHQAFRKSAESISNWREGGSGQISQNVSSSSRCLQA